MAKTDTNKLEKFMNRLYKKTINRYPRNEEEAWFLDSMAQKGVEDTIIAFYMSDLFETYSNKDFVTALFKGIMDTNPDDERFNFWMGKMEIRSKVGVIKGFFLSDEWANLCKTYGITV